jgi:FtsP/CotA-like multicopper oxidase with cupredoxin domain
MNSQEARCCGRVSRRVVALTLLGTSLVLCNESSAQERVISTHDNLQAAGSLNGDVLTVELVAEEGMWYPGGEEANGLPMYAFREAGGRLQIPGPLVRVTQNTEIVLKIRNAVAGGELHLRGLHAYDGSPGDIVRIPMGETRTLRFSASTPGAFLYWASINGTPLNRRGGIDSQLSGAFVVDPVGYDESDRILVLGEYQGIDTQQDVVLRAEEFTINGRSWPSTERIDVQVGETNRWHIINSSLAGHPMHLHGIHYRVVGTADGIGYRPIPVAEQREVVTELVPRGETMTMEWEAANAGNWLFHCHIVGHVDPANMYSVRGSVARDYDHFNEQQMSGMALGIHAHGSDKYATDAQPSRFLTMELNREEDYFGDKPGIAVAFNEQGSSENPPVVPGPPLFLNRNELVSIEVVNNLDEPTSIHWHGMELKSYFDGVAGFGGNGTSITPAIEPGHSFDVRIQPPRSGTFLYHTHLNDEAQLSAGLYGTMIVSDEDEPFDAETDRFFVIGLLGETGPQGLRFDGPRVGINGSTSHEQQFTLGQEYRLRIMNIAANNAGFAVWLNSPAGYEQWTPVAQDGADLPESYQVPVMAQRQQVTVGQTFDFLWTPQRPGVYWLEVRRGGNGEFMGQAQLLVTPDER